MQFRQALLPGTHQLRLEHFQIDPEAHHFTLQVSSIQPATHCPLSRELTQRTLADLPCLDPLEEIRFMNRQRQHPAEDNT
ncbi:MAG: hypothetical protein HC921_06740 [Synechococcaceae cyanobacterium SM2_3_1]|nr:hypothetical protein [Synechococcaceae cyanobacterium SM2_3_1]